MLRLGIQSLKRKQFKWQSNKQIFPKYNNQIYCLSTNQSQKSMEVESSDQNREQDKKQKSRSYSYRLFQFMIGFGLVGTGILIQNNSGKISFNSQIHQQKLDLEKMFYDESIKQIYFEEEKNLFQRIINRITIIIRFLKLGIFYLPTMLIIPFYHFFPNTFEDIFLTALSFGIQNSGSVIIKLAQYGSHRPDIFNQKFIDKFQHLRVDAPQHSYKKTEEILENNKILGKISGLKKQPIASGVIGQVYDAVYQGKRVAIKVRHPQIMENIKMDLQIVFGISQFLSQFNIFNALQMPLTIDEFIKVLVNQTDFRMEAKHLEKFNNNFKNLKNKIIFPTSLYASEDLMIQNFMDSSKNISDFIGQKDHNASKIIAKYGLEAIYKMFLYDNFVHADCHAGNIYVQITPKEKKESSIYQKNIFPILDNFQTQFLKYGQKVIKIFNNQIKNLPISSKQITNEKQEMLLRLFEIFEEVELEDDHATNASQEDFDYKLIFLDTGMVTTLNEKNYVDMMYLVTSVILKDTQSCIQAVQRISVSGDDNKLSKFEELVKPTFDNLKDKKQREINVGEIVQDIILCAQKSNIMFDGNMATLLQNIIVLEGLARQLHPDINIIGSSLPFILKNFVQNPIKLLN